MTTLSIKIFEKKISKYKLIYISGYSKLTAPVKVKCTGCKEIFTIKQARSAYRKNKSGFKCSNCKDKNFRELLQKPRVKIKELKIRLKGYKLKYISGFEGISARLKDSKKRKVKKISVQCLICKKKLKMIPDQCWRKRKIKIAHKKCRDIEEKKIKWGKHFIIHGSIADHPKLVRDYDFNKNKYKPKDLPNNYRRNLYWKCHKCNHEWSTTIRNRLKPTIKSKRYRECPVCILKTRGETYRINSLKKSGSAAEKFPHLLKEWDKEKNKLTLYDVSPYSSKIIYWRCNRNHSWPAQVGSRTGKNETGCPHCNNNSVSKAEIRIYSEFLKIFDNVIWGYWFKRRQIDIYLPSKNIGFEVDGHRHANKYQYKKDREKNRFFKKTKNIQIIRLRDSRFRKKINNDDFYINTSLININDIKKCFKILLKKSILNNKEVLSIQKYLKRKDYINNKNYRKILSYLPGPLPEKSILRTHSKKAKLFDYIKNKPLSPIQFSYGSQDIVWWFCKKHNFSFESGIKNYVKTKNCCRYGYLESKA